MLNRTFQRLISATLMLVAVGCAPHAPSDSSARTNRAVITDAEIPTTGSESALDLIQRIRPEYVRPKPSQAYSGGGSSTAPPPAVFLNGQRLGELADLRQIAAQSLSGVRYYNIEEAKRKFGMQYGGGVIEISYRSP
ncbi:MAG: hypothetical protein HOQ16_11265 [Gemmatimonadaceae bacterium]|nr:hypothetical protein [Gemmatimonadaceae bacterium]NUP71786.1 hypothetical protein [Gemmatimonadaceae bacterium]NUS48637.1 hypothetical protein [Gemmatimonadaceae bacterium]